MDKSIELARLTQKQISLYREIDVLRSQLLAQDRFKEAQLSIIESAQLAISAADHQRRAFQFGIDLIRQKITEVNKEMEELKNRVDSEEIATGQSDE